MRGDLIQARGHLLQEVFKLELLALRRSALFARQAGDALEQARKIRGSERAWGIGTQLRDHGP